MTENKWRNKKVRSFRVSETLELMIEQECQKRQMDFSAFLRYAAVMACQRQMAA